MGAAPFFTLGTGADVDVAFGNALADARFEHGHLPYTGTIAEKDGWVILNPVSQLETNAYRQAETLIDVDVRVGDKYGPAGALAVVFNPRTTTLTVPEFTPHQTDADTQAALTQVVLELLRRKRGLRRGENLVTADVVSYTCPQTRYGFPRRWSEVTTTVTIAKSGAALTSDAIAAAKPEGWLFFGYAKS